MSKLKPVKFEDFNEGNSASFAKTITESDVTIFAGISGDFNPLHINEVFAKTQLSCEPSIFQIFYVFIIHSLFAISHMGNITHFLSNCFDNFYLIFGVIGKHYKKKGILFNIGF